MRCLRTIGVLVPLLLAPAPAWADAFDHYFNDVLAQVPGSPSAKKVTELTPAAMVQHSRVLPATEAAFLVVKTNEGRFSKLLVLPARQKISASESVPILLIERYVTYREGEERTVESEGKNVRLFHDFRFSLDIGQVVPEQLPADLRFVAVGDKVHVEPVGKAELYLLHKHLVEANPKGPPRPMIGEKFEAKYFTGNYQLHDDGRRSGLLKLRVADDGEVSGDYYSDKDGQKYPVSGAVTNPRHHIQFRVTFPRSVQSFQGFLFTGDGRAITGSSRLQERETGFYALRLD